MNSRMIQLWFSYDSRMPALVDLRQPKKRQIEFYRGVWFIKPTSSIVSSFSRCIQFHSVNVFNRECVTKTYRVRFLIGYPQQSEPVSLSESHRLHCHIGWRALNWVRHLQTLSLKIERATFASQFNIRPILPTWTATCRLVSRSNCPKQRSR